MSADYQFGIRYLEKKIMGILAMYATNIEWEKYIFQCSFLFPTESLVFCKQYVIKSCVLYILPQMLPYLHRRNWAKSQESNWRAFAKRTQQHSWISCGTTFQLHRSQYYRCPGARYAFVSRFQQPLQTNRNEANISAGDRAAG